LSDSPLKGSLVQGGEFKVANEEVRHVGSDTLRVDFDASKLRLAAKTKDGAQARPLLALCDR